MTRLEIYKECVSEFGIDPALMDEYVVSESYNPLTDGDPDEDVAEDVIAEIRAEWMPIIADWVRRSEEKKRNYVLPHAPNETNERRTGTAITRPEIIKQAAAEFGIEDEFVDTLLASANPELLEVQLAFDEELSEDEAKCVRNLWMNHYSSMREAIAASTDKARTGDNYGDKLSRERDRWMRSAITTIIAAAVAGLAVLIAGHKLGAPNYPADIVVARSPEVRRAIPVEIRRAIPVEPEIRKAIPVRQFQARTREKGQSQAAEVCHVFVNPNTREERREQYLAFSKTTKGFRLENCFVLFGQAMAAPRQRQIKK
jgi:hypothetical protein